MILVWVLCVVFVLWFAMFRYRRQRLYELAAKVKVMDESKPVVGVAPSLMGNTEDIMAALQRFSYESMDENGLKIGWLGHILYFVSVNPYDLEVILKSCLEKDDLHRFVRKVTGNGGIFAPVSIWRRRRKILVPAFSPKIIENFVEVFAEQADLLAGRLKECANAKPFSIWPYLSSYTLDSVCESAMGVKINAQSNLDSPFLKALNRLLNLICERIFHLWLQADWMYQCFVNKYNEHQTCLAIMHNFTDEVIEKKRKEIIMRDKSIPKEKDFVSIWRRRRKILVPAFSPKIIENFVEVFAEQADLLAGRLKECANAKPFSIWPYLSSYTLDSVCESAMGVKINAQSNLDSPFLKALNRLLNLICERIFHLWLQADWMYQCFVNKYNEHQTCLAIMHNFTDEVIEKKRKEIIMRDKSIPKEKDFDLDTYHRKSFLDLLITFSGGDKGYSNVELREEILTLTVAGTDTSAVATGYTLKLLAKYPAVQERLYQELHEVFGDSDRRVEKEDLLRLCYLERVIKESMRLFPPVPFVIRKVLEEIQLPSGRTLPAGSGVVVSIWGVHRDPHYWGPDAEHFDPDRFLPGRLNLPHPTCFMPFSSGPRNCVGYQYAMMSVKTAITSIVRRYKVVGEPEKGPIPYIRVKLDIMMKASDGYQVALEKRSGIAA